MSTSLSNKPKQWFAPFCSTNGLYAKSTFQSLFGSISRILRDYPLEGLVLVRTLGDPDFESFTLSIETRESLQLLRLDDHPMLVNQPFGFIVVISNRFCTALYWSPDTQDIFQMYEGGWTFHPKDSQVIAQELINGLEDSALKALLESTPADRRYDEKLSFLTTTLVNSLEQRNRELLVALERVNTLNQKVLEQERMVAIGQLCSVVAHEIRNPLGLIDLYTKLVESQVEKVVSQTDDASVTGMLTSNLSQIRNAIQHLDGILSELTDYSRPLQLELETLSLQDFVEDICHFMAPSYVEKGVMLSFTPHTDLKSLVLPFDSRRMRQALLNILKNALEASPEKSTVSVHLDLPIDTDQIRILVSDQGNGIPENLRQKLFTPYFSTKKNGTGLGLAHVRKILQAHGGNITLLDSLPNSSGACFSLVLPYSTASVNKNK